MEEDHHFNMVLQEEDGPIHKANKAQILSVQPWGHETMGGELLVDLLYSGQLDIC